MAKSAKPQWSDKPKDAALRAEITERLKTVFFFFRHRVVPTKDGFVVKIQGRPNDRQIADMKKIFPEATSVETVGKVRTKPLEVLSDFSSYLRIVFCYPEGTP